MAHTKHKRTPDSATVSLRLPVALWDDLQAVADHRGISRNKLIAGALRGFIAYSVPLPHTATISHRYRVEPNS